uniref:Uncharacterized protein n=1 Tax=Wuchereria bancrofti TaxID=6293 RepID=A0AAF5Q4H6_WUCBA
MRSARPSSSSRGSNISTTNGFGLLQCRYFSKPEIYNFETFFRLLESTILNDIKTVKHLQQFEKMLCLPLISEYYCTNYLNI